VFFKTEKEHRALIVLRGEDLHEQISETDPQKTGAAPLPSEGMVPAAAHTASILAQLIGQVRKILADESKANMVLLRGYAKYRPFPGMEERYKLRSLAIASYPMYRGISRLLGMTIHSETQTIEDEIAALEASFSSYDFFFVHIKPTDSRGEDGNFLEKVKVIEAVDNLVPRITALKPDVLVVTGDHSTPSVMGVHSWHPVPVLLAAKTCRPDPVEHFGERDCLRGGLGRLPMTNLMALALAHTGRLEKFGA
jgi:2,3-bisphosphoglycerate-independent phosphoglycerate mutase